MNTNKWAAFLAAIVAAAVLSTVSPSLSHAQGPSLRRTQQPSGHACPPSDGGAIRSYSFAPGTSVPLMRMYSQPTTRFAPSRSGSVRRSTDLIERKLRPNVGFWK